MARLADTRGNGPAAAPPGPAPGAVRTAGAVASYVTRVVGRRAPDTVIEAAISALGPGGPGGCVDEAALRRVRRVALAEVTRSRPNVRRLSRLGSGCAVVPDLLAARASGEISAGDAAVLYRHLDRCPDCAELTGRFDAAEWHLRRSLPVGAAALAGAAATPAPRPRPATPPSAGVVPPPPGRPVAAADPPPAPPDPRRQRPPGTVRPPRPARVGPARSDVPSGEGRRARAIAVLVGLLLLAGGCAAAAGLLSPGGSRRGVVGFPRGAGVALPAVRPPAPSGPVRRSPSPPGRQAVSVPAGGASAAAGGSGRSRRPAAVSGGPHPLAQAVHTIAGPAARTPSTVGAPSASAPAAGHRGGHPAPARPPRKPPAKAHPAPGRTPTGPARAPASPSRPVRALPQTVTLPLPPAAVSPSGPPAAPGGTTAPARPLVVRPRNRRPIIPARPLRRP